MSAWAGSVCACWSVFVVRRCCDPVSSPGHEEQGASGELAGPRGARVKCGTGELRATRADSEAVGPKGVVRSKMLLQASGFLRFGS